MAASDVAINGDDVFVEISSDGGTTWEKLGELTNCSLTRNHEPREVTDKYDAGVRKLAEGNTNWELSGEGNVAYASEPGFVKPNDLEGHLGSRTKLDARFTTSVVGDYQYAGQAFVTSFELSAGTGETQTYSITLQGTGALTSSDVQ